MMEIIMKQVGKDEYESGFRMGQRRGEDDGITEAHSRHCCYCILRLARDSSSDYHDEFVLYTNTCDQSLEKNFQHHRGIININNSPTNH